MIWRSFSTLDMRDTPPSARMSAGTLSSAMTEVAPASSAILAWSAVTTSMMTPPLSISARPVLRRRVPLWPFCISLIAQSPLEQFLKNIFQNSPPRNFR